MIVLISGIYAAHRSNQKIRNSYAVWWVADMVVEHMKANEGEWPSTWDDLRDDYQTCVARSGQPWTFEELSQRVRVDWDADPEMLLTESQGHESARFKVIRLSDGTGSHWDDREPNQIVLGYLRSRAVK